MTVLRLGRIVSVTLWQRARCRRVLVALVLVLGALATYVLPSFHAEAIR